MIKENGAIDGNVPSIMKKFGKPGTVVPKYAVGPPWASLYSFSVPLVPCTFKGYSSCQTCAPVSVPVARPNSTYGNEACTINYYVEVDYFCYAGNPR